MYFSNGPPSAERVHQVNFVVRFVIRIEFSRTSCLDVRFVRVPHIWLAPLGSLLILGLHSSSAQQLGTRAALSPGILRPVAVALLCPVCQTLLRNLSTQCHPSLLLGLLQHFTQLGFESFVSHIPDLVTMFDLLGSSSSQLFSASSTIRSIFRIETASLFVCDGFVGLVLGRHVQVLLSGVVGPRVASTRCAQTSPLSPPPRVACGDLHLCSPAVGIALSVMGPRVPTLAVFFMGSRVPIPGCLFMGSGPNPWLFHFLHGRLARVSYNLRSFFPQTR